MSEELQDDHITAEQLTLYYGGELPEGTSTTVEVHLAECTECIVLARKLYSASVAFARWLEARELKRSSEGAVALAVDVAQAETVDPRIRERLKNWSQGWKGRAEGIIRVILGSDATAPVVITGGLEGLLRPNALWRFELEPALSFGAVRGPAATVIPVAVSTGSPAVKVAVSAEVKEIEVRIDNMPPGKSAPLVLLCSVTASQPPRVGELRKVPGTGYWSTRFEGVAQGDYMVAFEPIEHGHR